MKGLFIEAVGAGADACFAIYEAGCNVSGEYIFIACKPEELTIALQEWLEDVICSGCDLVGNCLGRASSSSAGVVSGQGREASVRI